MKLITLLICLLLAACSPEGNLDKFASRIKVRSDVRLKPGIDDAGLARINFSGYENIYLDITSDKLTVEGLKSLKSHKNIKRIFIRGNKNISHDDTVRLANDLRCMILLDDVEEKKLEKFIEHLSNKVEGENDIEADVEDSSIGILKRSKGEGKNESNQKKPSILDAVK